MPSSKKNLYPNKIKAIRSKGGFTKKGFSEALKIGERTLGYYESGERRPNAILGAHMARLCSVDIGDFYPEVQKGVVGSKKSTTAEELDMSQKDQLIGFLNQQVRDLQAEVATLKQTAKGKKLSKP